MSSFITSVFKATIGLLVDKARSHAAEELKDGDVVDQKFRNLVVKEIDDIKSKLDSLAKRELEASLDIFMAGVVCLNQVFQKVAIDECGTIVSSDRVTGRFGRFGQLFQNTFCKRGDKDKTSARKKNDHAIDVSGSSCQQLAKPSVEADLIVAKGLKHLQLADLNDSAKLSFEDAKKRFDEARVEATRAFRNEVLSTSDRILAMEIRLMSTLLGRVDRLADAVDECRLCLQNLHTVTAVRENFRVQLAGGVKSMINRHAREAIIAHVCRVNHAIFVITQMINGSSESDDSVCHPDIEIGNTSIDVLHDKKVMKILLQLDMAHCCHGQWTFGQEEERVHNLKAPEDLCTNSCGQFIVADRHKVKVFTSSGKFVCNLTVAENKEFVFVPNAVATDSKDHVYVLATLWNKKQAHRPPWRGVYVYDNHFEFQHRFRLIGRLQGDAMAVNEDDQIFVVGTNSDQWSSGRVHVYDANGEIVRTYEHNHKYQSFDCTAASDGRFMILDKLAQLVHVFSARGDKMREFSVQGERNTSSIAFNRSRKQVIVASRNRECVRGQVELYTEDGEFVRRIELNSEKESMFHGATVTVDGRIAVTSYHEGKVYVC